jgi:hypothetical protein
MRQQPLTRRLLLRSTAYALGGGAIAAGLSGCGSDQPVASISPDQAALNAALAGERALVALLADGVVRATPAQIRRAQAASASHTAHVTELVAAGASETEPLPTPTSSTTTTSPPGTPSPTEAPTGDSAPDPAAVVTAQVAQADALSRTALGVSPRLARLLGSIAASDAAQASLMRQGR